MSIPKKFVGLHAHTGFSMYDGFGMPEEHIKYAHENGMDAMAITEHGNMSSFPNADLYTKELKKKGINFKHLPGVEAYYHPDLDEWRKEKERISDENKEKKKQQKKEEELADDEDSNATENEEETKNVKKYFNPINRRHHMVLLAKSNKGLENLFRLVSRSFKDGFYRYPRIDRKMLKEYGEDIIATSACIGGVIAYDVFSNINQSFDSIDVNNVLKDSQLHDKIMKQTLNTCDQINDAVGYGNFYVEMQFNKLEQQHIANKFIMELHKKGMPIIAAADSHYCKPELWRAREIYKKLGRLNYEKIDPNMIPKDVESLKCELFPKNATQMWDSYKRYCEGYDFYDDEIVSSAIENTWHIAHDVIGNISLSSKMKLPNFVVPKGMTAFQALIEECKLGMVRRGLSRNKKYIERLKSELEVIKVKEFSQYFLTMKAIIDIAHELTLVGCGRGSGAGSLVNYVLGITQIDPIKYNLFFERFISLSRKDEPDIDNDLADRDLIIETMKKKFGEENIATITNFNTLKLKSLVKDLTRLHNIPFEEINEVTKNLEEEVKSQVDMPDNKGAFELNFEDCMEHSEKFRNFMEKYPEVSQDVVLLHKQLKAIAKHAGGVIVLEDMDKYMPLITTKGKVQTPWAEGQNVKTLSPYGIIKFDLLGVKTLRMIQDCIELILKNSFHKKGLYLVHLNDNRKYVKYGCDEIILENNHVIKIQDLKVGDILQQNSLDDFFKEPVNNVVQQIDFYEGSLKPSFLMIKEWYEKVLWPGNINEKEVKVFKNIFQEGKFAGIFQFTETNTQTFIKNFMPTCVDDLAVATAIYRPGPLAAKADKLYIERKNGDSFYEFDHPAIEKVAGPTYGLLVFQEQIMSIAHELGGMSLDDCDRLRKAILKKTVAGSDKNKSESQILEEMFIEGAVKNGYDKGKAERLYEDMRAFSAYAFNKSHSVSYAICSYQTAWLMTYFEKEWLTSYVESMNEKNESMAKAISIIKANNYIIKKPDINISAEKWIADDNKNFFMSLNSLTGMGEKAVNEIIEKRPYKNLYDLLWDEEGEWKHQSLNKRGFEVLIKTKAFESMKIVSKENPNPFLTYKQMYHCIVENLEDIKKKETIAKGKREVKLKGKSLLKKLINDTSLLEEYQQEWSDNEFMQFYKDIVGGVDISYIIDDKKQQLLRDKGVLSISTLELNDENIVWFIVTNSENKISKNGKPYILLTAIDDISKEYKVYLWNAPSGQSIELNKAYIAKTQKTNFGYSVRFYDMKGIKK
jgi:DNA polymerase III alpha subunit